MCHRWRMSSDEPVIAVGQEWVSRNGVTDASGILLGFTVVRPTAQGTWIVRWRERPDEDSELSEQVIRSGFRPD